MVAGTTSLRIRYKTLGPSSGLWGHRGQVIQGFGLQGNEDSGSSSSVL